MAWPWRTIENGSGEKGDAIPVAYEKDEVWGATGRRPLRPTRVQGQPVPVYEETQAGYMIGDSLSRADMETHPFGPEAEERARDMQYDRITRIQKESPYVAEEVVEHVVHDHRLYVGMWVTAGVAAVCAFVTYSLPCLLIMGVALGFALSSTPGRQSRD